MKISSDLAKEIINEDNQDWKTISYTISDQDRWTTYFRYIFHHLSDNKYYSYLYGRGSTECQDYDDFEFDSEVEFTEVEKHTILTEDWVNVEECKHLNEVESKILKNITEEDRNRIFNSISKS